jgi:hypothetical protein
VITGRVSRRRPTVLLSVYGPNGQIDGLETLVDKGTVLWHGVQQTVLILATGRVPLLGMALVYGSRLTLGGVDDGALLLEELP